MSSALIRLLTPELAELIASQPFYQEGLRKVAALLPEEDAKLHELLQAAIEAGAGMLFTHLICAAALAGRRLQASLLAGGTALLQIDPHIAWIAWPWREK